jgi:hypothetical protein
LTIYRYSVGTSSRIMETSLEDYRRQIHELYEGKGWSTEFYYLIARAQQELSEYMQAVMKMEAGELNPKTNKPYTEADCVEEISDALHFIFESVTKKFPNADMDLSLQSKINSNWSHKKKTLDENGKVVLK